MGFLGRAEPPTQYLFMTIAVNSSQVSISKAGKGKRIHAMIATLCTLQQGWSFACLILEAVTEMTTQSKPPNLILVSKQGMLRTMATRANILT